MKTALELTLLEISCMMREAGPSAPEAAFTEVLRWVRDRQQYLREYAVQKQVEQVTHRAAPEVSRRKLRNLDADLWDEAVIVTEVMQPTYSQDCTEDKYDKLMGR